METPKKRRPLKMELEPDDPNLLANLLAAVTALVSGLEAVSEKLDAVHVDVRAIARPALRRGMQSLIESGTE